MRLRGYYLLALVFLSGILVLTVPDIPNAVDSLNQTSDPQIQGETLTRLLQDMQELAEMNTLKPEQRAEIKSLLSRARLLRQKLNNSDSLPPGQRQQLQEIRLRLDAIKNALPPPRPRNLKEYRTAVA